MKKLITTELKKYILLKRVFIVFFFVIFIFVFQILTASATTHSPYTLSIGNRGDFHNIQEEIKRIKRTSFSQTEINQKFQDDLDKEYRLFVDKNILDKESLMKNAKEFNKGYDELYKERYDIEESGLIFSEKIKYSDQMNLFSEKYAAMCEEIRRRSNFTSLRFHRLDDMVESIGLPKCKLCTYCFDGKEK